MGGVLVCLFYSESGDQGTEAAQGGVLDGQAKSGGRPLSDELSNFGHGMFREPEEELVLLVLCELRKERSDASFDFNATGAQGLWS